MNAHEEPQDATHPLADDENLTQGLAALVRRLEKALSSGIASPDPPRPTPEDLALLTPRERRALQTAEGAAGAANPCGDR